MVLSKKRIAKALIRLRGRAGWSAPVLFANTRRQVFSRRGPYGVWLLLESAAIPLEVQHQVPGDWLVLENLDSSEIIMWRRRRKCQPWWCWDHCKRASMLTLHMMWQQKGCIAFNPASQSLRHTVLLESRNLVAAWSSCICSMNQLRRAITRRKQSCWTVVFLLRPRPLLILTSPLWQCSAASYAIMLFDFPNNLATWFGIPQLAACQYSAISELL